MAAFALAGIVTVAVGGPVAAAAASAAATAAGLVVLGRRVRTLALPAVGVCAVMLAVGASNAAAVLPAWTVAAACLAATHAHRPNALVRRWTFGVLASDAAFAAGVILAAVDAGFGAWRRGLRGPAGVLVALAAVTRAPLLAGPLDRLAEPGLVLVRMQSTALVVLAIPPDVPRTAAIAAAAAGASLFALGPLASREGVRDGVQEVGSLIVAKALVGLGLLSPAWPGAALVVWTLVHLVRVANPRGGPARRLSRSVVAGATIGAPVLGLTAGFCAAAVVPAAGAARVVPVLLFAGLAGRAIPAPVERRDTAVAAPFVGALAVGAGVAVLAAGVGYGFAAMLPLLAVATGGIAGMLRPELAAPARPRRPRPSTSAAPPRAAVAMTRVLALGGRRAVVEATVGAYAAVSVVVLAVAYARGFL